MARSFIDHLASNPPTPRQRVSVIGLDPDIDIMGWAVVEAEIHGGLPPIYSIARLGCASIKEVWAKPVSGWEQAHAMAAGLATFDPLLKAFEAMDNGHAVVECQEVYARRDDPRPKLVRLGNDLLKVAHVAGALTTLTALSKLPTVVPLPKEWKANRTKEADHFRSMQMLYDTGATLFVPGQLATNASLAALTSLPARWEHALDGLGMALYGVERLHRGTWRP